MAVSKNHFESSRFTTIVVITLLCVLMFFWALVMSEKVAEAMVGPMFLALGVLWGALGASKIAEHMSKETSGD